MKEEAPTEAQVGAAVTRRMKNDQGAFSVTRGHLNEESRNRRFAKIGESREETNVRKELQRCELEKRNVEEVCKE
jgi:hypothetical protein